MNRFPTTLNLFGTPDSSFIFALGAAAARFEWREIHVVCDDSPAMSFPNTQCTNFLYSDLPGRFSGLLKLAVSRIKVFGLETINVTDALNVISRFRGEIHHLFRWLIIIKFTNTVTLLIMRPAAARLFMVRRGGGRENLRALLLKKFQIDLKKLCSS